MKNDSGDDEETASLLLKDIEDEMRDYRLLRPVCTASAISEDNLILGFSSLSGRSTSFACVFMLFS